MRHELAFLVASIIIVFNVPLQPFYILVYNQLVQTETLMNLKLAQLCLSILFVWGRHCIFFKSPMYSMQDIFLMLFIVSVYYTKSIVGFLVLAIAFVIWDIDCHCSPAIESDVRRIRFNRYKMAFLGLLIGNYFWEIPLRTTPIVPYFPTVHLFIIMTVRCILAYINEYVIFSDTLTFMVYTIPIASIESWLFSTSDFSTFASLNVINLAFYYVIFSISNVSHLFYVNPLAFSNYVNPYLIVGLLIFCGLASNNHTPLFWSIQIIKCLPVLSATKYMLPRSMINYNSGYNEFSSNQLELLMYHKRRNKLKLDIFTSVIYSLLIMNYLLFKDDLAHLDPNIV